MSKYIKEIMMDQYRADLGDERSVLILDLHGLDAISEWELRRQLREKNIQVRTVKNTLARKVFEDLDMAGLSQYLTGPSVMVWGGEGVAELAKEISKQAKDREKLEIKGGAVEGSVIGPEAIEDLTKLPSREELIGQAVGLVLGPAQQVLGLINSPGSMIVGQLEELHKRLGGGDEAGDGEAAPAES